MKLTEMTETEWRKFEKTAKFSVGTGGRNFLQSKEMFSRYKKQGREAYLVGLKKKGKVVLGALILGRKGRVKVFTAPGGPIGDLRYIGEFTEAAKGFLREKGGEVFRISPNIIARRRDIDGEIVPGGEDNTEVAREITGAGYKYLGENEQVKWEYVLFTQGRTEEEIYREFRKGTKLSIRYAEPRYGVKIRELKRGELSTLVELAEASGEYHGFRAPKLKYFEEMYDTFGRKVRFLVAEREGQAIAGAMFVLYGEEIVYLFSGSLREAKKYGGPHLLQWTMIKEAIRGKYKRYNFYGVRPEKGDGVYAFKRGFKGEVVELLGTFMLPLSFKGGIYAKLQKPRKFGEIS